MYRRRYRGLATTREVTRTKRNAGRIGPAMRYATLQRGHERAAFRPRPATTSRPLPQVITVREWARVVGTEGFDGAEPSIARQRRVQHDFPVACIQAIRMLQQPGPVVRDIRAVQRVAVYVAPRWQVVVVITEIDTPVAARFEPAVQNRPADRRVVISKLTGDDETHPGGAVQCSSRMATTSDSAASTPIRRRCGTERTSFSLTLRTVTFGHSRLTRSRVAGPTRSTTMMVAPAAVAWASTDARQRNRNSPPAHDATITETVGVGINRGQLACIAHNATTLA